LRGSSARSKTHTPIRRRPKPYHMPSPPTRLASLTEWGEALSAFRTRGEKGGGMVKLTNSLLRPSVQDGANRQLEASGAELGSSTHLRASVWASQKGISTLASSLICEGATARGRHQLAARLSSCKEDPRRCLSRHQDSRGPRRPAERYTAVSVGTRKPGGCGGREGRSAAARSFALGGELFQASGRTWLSARMASIE
jgi:hypothetical protein